MYEPTSFQLAMANGLPHIKFQPTAGKICLVSNASKDT